MLNCFVLPRKPRWRMQLIPATSTFGQLLTSLAPKAAQRNITDWTITATLGRWL
jgi:hypothetical protein